MNNSEIKYCVLFEPKNSFQKLIVNYKNSYKNLETRNNFFYHPPHLTIYLFNSSSSENKIISKFKKIRFKKITIDYDNWKTFDNDQNSGKDTVVLAFQLNTEIKKLQEAIAQSLNNLKTSKIEYKNEWEGLFKKSYLKWGYPFVGKHWIPHFTIGSFSKKNKSYLNELISKKNKFNKILIDEISLCRVNDDKHITISKILLHED